MFYIWFQTRGAIGRRHVQAFPEKGILSFTLDTLAAMVREQLGDPVPRAQQEHFYI